VRRVRVLALLHGCLPSVGSISASQHGASRLSARFGFASAFSR
jgi:hypothetical protein